MLRHAFLILCGLVLASCATRPVQTSSLDQPNSPRCAGCVFMGYGDRCPPYC
jgi:hypothetical protein